MLAMTAVSIRKKTGGLAMLAWQRFGLRRPALIADMRSAQLVPVSLRGMLVRMAAPWKQPGP